MTATLQNLLIALKGVPLEKVSFSDTQNPKTVNTFTADEKHYLLNRDNLTQPIQIQFSQKQITLSEVFFAISKSIRNFKHLPEKDDAHNSCVSGSTGSEKHG